MKNLKKLIAGLAVAATVFTSTNHLDAGYYDECGCGYEDCCTAPAVSPALALGVVAAVAIIAVLVHNSNNNSSHSHG